MIRAILAFLLALAQPAPAEERAVVWAAGDAATPGARADAVAALVLRGDPDRFLYLGDVYETGTLDEFRRFYHPRFGALARITESTLGNHEWANRRAGYYPYWTARRGASPPLWSKTRIAGWELVKLSSEAPHRPGSPQVRWLERAVAGPGNCRIAFWHRPRLSAGTHGSARDVHPLWSRLAGHARVVLGGHDHDLQRHRPRRGLVQYVVGAGGRERYPLDGDRSTLAWGTERRDGALRIVLRPGRALLEFRDPSGGVLDRSRVSCSPQ